MRTIQIILAIIVSVASSTSGLAEPLLKPVPLVFDTDLGNDVDGVLGLGLIHALQSRGECELVVHKEYNAQTMRTLETLVQLSSQPLTNAS